MRTVKAEVDKWGALTSQLNKHEHQLVLQIGCWYIFINSTYVLNNLGYNIFLGHSALFGSIVNVYFCEYLVVFKINCFNLTDYCKLDKNQWVWLIFNVWDTVLFLFYNNTNYFILMYSLLL